MLFAQSDASGTTSRDQRGTQLFTTQNDLELIVKNLLGQFTSGQRPDVAGHYASHQQASKPANNISFSKRKSAMVDLESVSSNLSGQLSSRIGVGQPLMMALDKDFLVQLENSLQRLVDSNEQVKQVAREKEQTE